MGGLLQSILCGAILLLSLASALQNQQDDLHSTSLPPHMRADRMIVPGGPDTPHWNDTDGNRIEAHGGGMLYSESERLWFWYGESKKTQDLSDHGITCYSSPALAGPWKYEGLALHQSDLVIPGASGPYVVERPKVLYNNVTRNYVLWFHLDNSGYSFRHAGVAVATDPRAKFRFVHSFQPDGVPSLDMNLFQDWDGAAYFIRSCDNRYVGISKLSSDFLNTTGIISTHDVFEGMAIFRLANGTYYVISSHLTGWDPNPLMLFRAAGPSLADPQWVNMGNPTNNPTSFNSQPTYVVQATAADGSHYFVYLADNWVHGGPAGLIDASYVWLPIRFSSNSVTLEWVREWDPLYPFAPPPPPPPCPAPAVSSRLSLQPCDSALSWVVNPDQPGVISPTLNRSLCVAPIGTDPYTGLPALALAPCTPSDSLLLPDEAEKNHHILHSSPPGYQFVYASNNASVIHTADHMCMDATYCSTDLCPGRYLALYACGSPHPNQQFVLHPDGRLVAGIDNSLCVSIC